MRKKVTTTIYITPEQNEQLKTLHEQTKVPIAEYIRQGIDMILKKNAHQLPRQMSIYDLLNDSLTLAKPDDR